MQNETPGNTTAWPFGQSATARDITQGDWASSPAEAGLLYNDEHGNHTATSEQKLGQFQNKAPLQSSGDGPKTRWFTGSWTPIRLETGERGVLVHVAMDATARHTAEQALEMSEARRPLLLRLRDALRTTGDPAEMRQLAMVCEQLGFSRAFYFLVEREDGHWVHLIESEFRRDPTQPSMIGRHSLKSFGSWMFEGLAKGLPAEMADVNAMPRLTPEEIACYKALGVTAFINVPLLRNGEYSAGITAHEPKPHVWTEDEISLMREVGVRTWEAVERARAQKALHDSERKYRTLFESVDEGFCIIEMIHDSTGRTVDHRYLEVNPAFLRLTGFKDVVGRTIKEIAPATEDYWIDNWDRVARTGEVSRLENFHEATGHWYSVHASRVGGEGSRIVALVFDDVTDRKRQEQRQKFLLKLADVLRPVSEALAIQQAAMRVLGEQLDVDRVLYAEFEPDGSEYIIPDNYVRAGVAKRIGRFSANAFSTIIQCLGRGETCVIADVRRTSMLSDAEKEASIAAGMIALVSVPLLKGDRLVAQLGVQNSRPREWTTDDIAILQETAERTWAALERARAEDARRKTEEDYRALFNAMDQGFCIIERVYTAPGEPHDYRYMVANPAFERHTGMRDVLGKTIRELVPGAEKSIMDRYDQVLETGVALSFENYVESLDLWIDVETFPARLPGQIAVLFRDVSARKRSEAALRNNQAQQAFLLKLSDAMRPLVDVAEIQRTAMDHIVRHFGVEMAAFIDFGPDGDRGVIREGHKSTRIPLPRELRLSDFGPVVVEELLAGRIFASEDLDADPRLETNRAAYRALNIRSGVGIPLIKAGRLASAVTVNHTNPRRWRADELRLLEDAAERTWGAVERAQAERNLRDSEAQLAIELADTQQLQRISSSFIKEDNIAALYDQILDVARALMRSGMASIQEFSPERNALFLLAQQGFAPESAKFWEWVHADEATSCAVALANSKAVIVSDVELWDVAAGTEDLAHYRLCGIRAMLSTPLISRDGRLVGVISTHWPEVHQPSQRELRLLDVLARQAGDLIEKCASEQALRTNEKRLRGQKEAFQSAMNGAPLHESLGALVRIVGEETGGAARSAFYVADLELGYLQPIPGAGDLPPSEMNPAEALRIGLDQHGCGLAIASGHAVLTRDILEEQRWAPWVHLAKEQDFRACGSFCIQTRAGKPIGTFAMYFRTPHDISPNEFSLAEIVTQTAAIILSRHTEAEERARAEETLLDNEQQFRLFVENVHEYALIQTDPEGVITSWNPGAERLFGYLSDEVMGHPFTHLVGPDEEKERSLEHEIEDVSHGIQREDAQWLTRKDGTRFWAQWVSEAIYDGHGQLRGIAKLMRDETDRQKNEDKIRHSLAEKEQLLKEVHHRVKNNLQVISSLVNLQASQNEDPKVLAAFVETRNRVFSIAAIHEMLYQSAAFEAIDMVEYAKRLVPDLIQLYGVQESIKVRISGKATLELERAVPYGLLLNELVANVCKHAFPGGRSGELTISFHRDARHTLMSFSDNGVGLPPGFVYERANSLGLKLVHNLARQLRATLDVHSKDGTSVTVRIPERTELYPDE